MLKYKKTIVAVIILIVIAGVIIWAVTREEDPAAKYLTEEVSVQDVSQTVSATGELKSQSEVALNFENTGRVESIEVEVGDQIAIGDVLATLENDILKKQAEKAEQALKKATADAGSSDDVIRELEESVDNAEDYLDETKELEDQKVAAAKQAYEDAASYYEAVVDYYEENVDQYGVDNVNTKNALLTLKTAERNKNSAEQALKTAKKARTLAETSAKNALDSTEEKLETAESDYSKRSRNAAVEAARADYEIALANLDKASLKAPTNGEVVEINYEVGEVLGSSAMGATGFGKMISSDFVLEADITETDISKIELDQKAELSFDALPFDEKIEAEVIEIDPAATVIQDVVYYKAKLSLAEMDARLKEGMSADVDIRIDEKAGSLTVPQSAIEYEDTGKFVEIINLETGEIEKRKVETGLEGDSGIVQIISGVQEGENVIVAEKNK